MNKPKIVAGLGIAALVILFPMTLHAQSLSEVLVDLVLSDIQLRESPPGFLRHVAHFAAANNPDIVPVPFQFNRTVLAQLSTFPLGSSAGGFTSTYDPALGTSTRNSTTFGPAFTERALTIGRKKFNFGATYEHTSYNSFEGKDLKNNDVKFYISHEPCCPGQFFEGDLVEAALRLDLSTDTFSIFGNYGVGDHLDIGVAVPFVHVDMNATSTATILTLATDGIPIHRFPDGTTQQIFRGGGTASGIGDIVLRAKYNFWAQPGGGLAGGVDLRLPTGDDANLLGTGATQTKLLLIYSGTANKVSPHVNFGYTFSGESTDLNQSLLAGIGNPSVDSNLLPSVVDEVNYAGGLEVELSPKVTLVGDLIGRTLRGFGRLETTTHTFTFKDAQGNPGSKDFEIFNYQSTANLNLVLAAVGAKINPAKNLLVSAHVLFPLTDAGLRSRFTTVLGFDYAF